MREIKRIRAFTDWAPFFRYLHLTPPSDAALLEWLHRAAANSARKRYHRPDDFVRELRVKSEEKAARRAARDAGRAEAMDPEARYLDLEE